MEDSPNDETGEETSGADVEVTLTKQKSLENPQVARSVLFEAYRKRRRNHTNANVKAGWHNRFPYLSFRDFLVYMKSMSDDQTKTPSSSLKTYEAEKRIFVDGKDSFVGDIYRDLECDEEIGFDGKSLEEIEVWKDKPTSAEIRPSAIHADVITDVSEIFIVPTARFVREIGGEKQDNNNTSHLLSIT